MLAMWMAATLTHGVAVGEVTATSALVWTRVSESAEVRVDVDVDPAFGNARTERSVAPAETDFTVRVFLDALEPNTTYHYRVRADGGEPVIGSFRTAPSPEAPAPVSFVVMGDLGGHGYCREEGRGYEVFAHMSALEPSFLIANGDMIYADSECPSERPEGGRNVPGDFPRIDDPKVDWTDAADVREIYLAHWRYNRADRHFQGLLARTPMYVQWDDHEVINDFGAIWPTWTAALERDGYQTLVREGRRALFDFHPIARHPGEPDRIYRSFRWGRHVELFLLDARSYRSLNDLADRPDNDKTLLGREQLEWLKQGLQHSDATWKIVSSDVPLSIPTGSQAHLFGRDAFADGTDADYSARTGFERELTDLLRHLDAQNVTDVVFVATDVHFATTLRYEIDVDGDSDVLLFHELISGPLSAFKSPARAPDPTFRPRILYAEGNLFNFAYVRVEPGDGRARLVADVRDDEGEVRLGSRLELSPQ